MSVTAKLLLCMVAAACSTRLSASAEGDGCHDKFKCCARKEALNPKNGSKIARGGETSEKLGLPPPPGGSVCVEKSSIRKFGGSFACAKFILEGEEAGLWSSKDFKGDQQKADRCSKESPMYTKLGEPMSFFVQIAAGRSGAKGAKAEDLKQPPPTPGFWHHWRYILAGAGMGCAATLVLTLMAVGWCSLCRREPRRPSSTTATVTAQTITQ
uniref:Pherophorin domain-containing protein n=2 Tax=Zooxanthella nutricula TaxID=1333877 RepID=A0A7S2JTK8_9DINO